MNNQESIRLKLLLTEKEFIFLFLFLQIKSILIKSTCFSIILIIYFRAVYEMSLFTNIVLAVFLIFFIVVPLAILFLAYRAKKEYKSNYSFHNESIIEFDDSGYLVTTNNTNRNHREWDYLHSVREVKPGFFLYYSLQTATYIPKRCFDSEKDIEVFKDLVSAHLDSKSTHFKSDK